MQRFEEVPPGFRCPGAEPSEPVIADPRAVKLTKTPGKNRSWFYAVHGYPCGGG
jgi:hypothetical protein